MRDFKAVLAKWPSLREVSNDTGIEYEAVCQWNKRNHIPVAHWTRVVNAGRNRGFKFSRELFLDIFDNQVRARAK